MPISVEAHHAGGLPTAVWMTLLIVFAGYTASFVCVVLERRLVGGKPTGRSVCACGKQIPLYRNVPIVTWLLQRGRAACCGVRIPAWYFGAEAITVTAAVALALTPTRWVGGLIGVALATVSTCLWHRSRVGTPRRNH